MLIAFCSVLSRSKSEQPEFIRSQREIAAQICYQLAEYHNEQKNVDKAQGFYNEALRHDDTHEKSILSLAKLYPIIFRCVYYNCLIPAGICRRES